MLASILFTIISILDGFGRPLFSNATAKALPSVKNACQGNIVARLKTLFLYTVFINSYVCVDECPKASYTLIAKYAKTIAKCKNRKVYAGYFTSLFSCFTHPFLLFALRNISRRIGIHVKSQIILWFIFSQH